MFDVVVATYNGERFLREQIESIVMANGFETLVNRVIIVDDGSSDTTIEIIEGYCDQYPCFELYKSEKRLGPTANFNRALERSSANWVLLADQDDVWMSDKLTRFAQKCAGIDSSMPVALFSDVAIVDSNLDLISDTYFSHFRVRRDWYQQKRWLAIENVVPGCSMAVSRGLLTLALPIPSVAKMHDWWLLLIASSQGELIHIDKALVKYRQHDSNTVGATKISVFTRVVSMASTITSYKTKLADTLIQAKTLGFLLDDAELAAIGRLGEASKLSILKAVLQGRLRRSSLTGTIFLLFLLFFCIRSSESQN